MSAAVTMIRGGGELSTRAFSLRASSLNKQARTVEAVLATESVVTVLDPRSWELVDEVLLMDGARLPATKQVPLLDSHDRSSVQKQLGSTRDIRAERAELIGRRHFSSDADAVRAFTKVEEGHLTDGSIGYVIIAAVRIEPAQTIEVAGKSWTAGERILQVVTEWELREDSVLPVGADRDAKMRGQQELKIVVAKESEMNSDKPTDTGAAEPAEGKRAPAKVPVKTPTKPPAEPAGIAAALEERKRMVLACTPASLREFAEQVLLEQPDYSFEECRAAIAAKHAEDRKPAGTPEPPKPDSQTDERDQDGEPKRMADVTDEMLIGTLSTR